MLSILVTANFEAPYFFSIKSSSKRCTCGVLEFSAREGTCEVPTWMYDELNPANDEVEITRIPPPPLGTYVKFQPHKTAFIELANPKVVLERHLTSYCCLTKGETIQVGYNGINYKLNVVDVKPNNNNNSTINIIDTVLDLEFDAPIDYVEPTPSVVEKTDLSSTLRTEENHEIKHEKKFSNQFVPFAGQGYSLTGNIPNPPSINTNDSLNKYGHVIV